MNKLIGRYDDNTLVKFSFIMSIGNEKHEVKGVKTLKLFRSWFRLACNFHYPYMAKRELLYGTVEFGNGEKWIWQNRKHVYRGGWKLVVSEATAFERREAKMIEINKKREERRLEKEREENRKWFDGLIDDMFS